MEQFNVQECVIDALPETRLARDFARQHRNVRLAYYKASGPDHGTSTR